MQLNMSSLPDTSKSRSLTLLLISLTRICNLSYAIISTITFTSKHSKEMEKLRYIITIIAAVTIHKVAFIINTLQSENFLRTGHKEHPDSSLKQCI